MARFVVKHDVLERPQPSPDDHALLGMGFPAPQHCQRGEQKGEKGVKNKKVSVPTIVEYRYSKLCRATLKTADDGARAQTEVCGCGIRVFPSHPFQFPRRLL